MPLVSSLVRLTPDRIPGEVVGKAKYCVMDALACALGGYDLPWVTPARELAMESGGRAEAAIWAAAVRVPAAQAAFANSVMAHSILQEDTHGESLTHPGTIVVPSALAVGERIGASGRNVLRAIVIGYEAMGRIGRALHTPEFKGRGYRPSGIFGPFGAAAAASALVGLDEPRFVEALALAGNVGAGMRQWAHEGTHDIFYHNGFAARNGVEAALLAERGVRGAKRILDGPAGLAHGYSGSTERLGILSEELGPELEIERVFFKATPACQAVQAATQLTIRLAQDHDIDPTRVRRVAVRTSVHSKTSPGNDFPGPFRSLSQAQMSNQFAIAIALLNRRATYEEYRNFDDARVAELARRVIVEIDEEIEARYPSEKGAKVEIELDDGRLYGGVQYDIKYPTPEELRDKFLALGARALPRSNLDSILEAIDHLDEEVPVAALCSKLLTPEPTTGSRDRTR